VLDGFAGDDRQTGGMAQHEAAVAVLERGGDLVLEQTLLLAHREEQARDDLGRAP
jgi:hypothetical protein